jgi:hypothetical protein
MIENVFFMVGLVRRHLPLRECNCASPCLLKVFRHILTISGAMPVLSLISLQVKPFSCDNGKAVRTCCLSNERSCLNLYIGGFIYA